MQQTNHTGRVVLIGAGPGDPELLTVKAHRFLQRADVVLTDRLVSEVILRDMVNPAAKVVYVGKQCRKGASTPQSDINELLVYYARQGNLVVRLKGGDVSIFSNILDELQVLTSHAIPYEIVPGITAALGAAACSGIPLTARGHSTAVRFLTYYKSEVIAEGYWRELAQTDDTLVFYMSVETIDSLVEQLTAWGIAKDKELAVVEQATTPLQNIYTCNLYDYKEQLSGKTFLSPSLIIIGRVVALHHHFRWLANSNSSNEYFKPAENRWYPFHKKAERA